MSELMKANGGAQVPDFLRENFDAKEGMDVVAENTATPRLALVQAMSNTDLKKEFGEGAAVLKPIGVQVAAPDEEFVAYPILHWVSYEKRSDPNDTDQNFIVESTQDPNSEIAHKASSPKTWAEPYGKKFEYNYVRALNYILLIDPESDSPAAGEIAAWTYDKTSFSIGRRLNARLQRRGTAIYNNRIGFRPIEHTSGPNTWWQLEVGDPEDGQLYVPDVETAEQLRDLHKEFDSARQASAFRVADHDVDVEPAESEDIS